MRVSSSLSAMIPSISASRASSISATCSGSAVALHPLAAAVVDDACG